MDNKYKTKQFNFKNNSELNSMYNISRNITVTIPIKHKYQSLIAAAIGTNGNNIRSVKSRIVSDMIYKFLYIYIKGEDDNKYWHISVAVNDPNKWKLLDRTQNLLEKHLDFFYKKKRMNEAVLKIQRYWRNKKQST
jgi:hypothetical protein